MRPSLLSLCLLGAVGVAADSKIIIPPPNATAGKKALLVFVPGGLVPNTQYQNVLQEVQRKLIGSVDLWVAIASCIGKLCIPTISSLEVKEAVNAGVKASGVSASETWMGGHSLGSEEADTYVRANTKTIGGGAFLWGGYVQSGVQGMLDYPVPVAHIVAELDYGSARSTKMAPYFKAAKDAGDAQFLRTLTVVVPDVDHSDFCEGFNVTGDLPSGTSAGAAVSAIAEATAEYMKATILQDAAAQKSLMQRAAFSATLFDPVNEALALEKGAGWCEMVVRGQVAPGLKFNTTGVQADKTKDWDTPLINVAGGSVQVQVTGFNTYEGAWPPHADSVSDLLQVQAKVPAVKRGTATVLGCRMPSRVAIASALGQKADEGANACEAANIAAWKWGMSKVAERVMTRYNSAVPCNGCAKGVPLLNNPDTAVSSSDDFKSAALGYNLTASSLQVQSPAYIDSAEHSCQLLSPARVLDFLMFDAYTVSRYS